MDKIKKAVMVTIMFLVITVLLLGKVLDANAARTHIEKWYQDAWCKNTLKIETEVVLSDGTRADCMSPNYAMEFDFGNKWYEGITQTLHYMLLSQRRGILVLIVEKPSELTFVERAYNLIDAFKIPIELYIYKGYGEDAGVRDYDTFKLLGAKK